MEFARSRAIAATSRTAAESNPLSLYDALATLPVYLDELHDLYQPEYLAALETIWPGLLAESYVTFGSLLDAYRSRRARAEWTPQQVAAVAAALRSVRRNIMVSHDLTRATRAAHRPPSPPLTMAVAGAPSGGGGGGGGPSNSSSASSPPRPPRRSSRTLQRTKENLFAFLAANNRCDATVPNGDTLMFARVWYRDRQTYRVEFTTTTDYGEDAAAFAAEVRYFFDIEPASAEYEYSSEYVFGTRGGLAVEHRTYRIETSSLEFASYVVYYFTLAYKFTFDIPDADAHVRLSIAFPYADDVDVDVFTDMGENTVLPHDVLRAIKEAGLLSVGSDTITLRNGTRTLNLETNAPFTLDTKRIHVLLGVIINVIHESDGGVTKLRVHLNDGTHRTVYANVLHEALNAAGLRGALLGRRFEPVPLTGKIDLDKVGTALVFRAGVVFDVRLPDDTVKQVLCDTSVNADGEVPASCVYAGLRELGLSEGVLLEQDVIVDPTDNVSEYAILAFLPAAATGGRRRRRPRTPRKRSKQPRKPSKRPRSRASRRR